MVLAEETIATFMAVLAQRLPRCFQLSTKMDGSKDGIQDRRVLNQNRNNRPLGRILQLYPGSDGIIRSVPVKTAAGSFAISIQKLWLIEAATL
ncbi:hypothetical protein T11_1981 [Trichinella zimbabwensis]|uniref:DUF5641 domain-containing protein n=1 Tax=Trichinella zimbabwensis TaxID=268475 RepID=A0A0V1HVL9_9BILA|nr:hypothetical protein T11_1981 [Trichinella zimbabwensis]